MTDLEVAAAHLAAALIHNSTMHPTTPQEAASIYFDVLDSLDAEVKNRRSSRPQAAFGTF